MPRRFQEAASPYNRPMYVIAIAWLYVVLMMSLTETSFIAGALTLIFYGLAPLALLLWLLGTPARRRRRRLTEALSESVGVAADQLPDQPDRGDAGQNH